jgi:transcriptional regulator with PAS, ATPase and Fis domain
MEGTLADNALLLAVEDNYQSAFTLSGLVGQSKGMLEILDHIRKAASVDAHVLILGESGAGKERVARAIHEMSPRTGRAFLAINCAAIPETLLEAELFGYERGAFTGAQLAKEGLLQAADGGTLLLDEVCELNPCLQAKLLRALEEGAARRLGGRKPIPFDVRFMASTNRAIHEEVRRGRFREDLFFRIDVIEIHVPPLRQRRADIPALAAHFLKACASQRQPRIEGITTEAMRALISYSWPGNVRELKNAVERAVAYSRGSLIMREDLPEAVLKGAERREEMSFRTWKRETLERLEREFLSHALAEHAGIVSHAARALRLHRSALQRLLRKYNLLGGSPPSRAASFRQ